MTAVVDPIVVDTSVILKWFHAEGESEVDSARAILEAHTAERLSVLLLDLSWFELGNLLVRALHWRPDRVADQLDDLDAICGPPLIADASWHRAAARLAAAHSLTFYDASFAAAAEAVGGPLVSADRQLIDAGFAVSPSSLVADLALG